MDTGLTTTWKTLRLPSSTTNSRPLTIGLDQQAPARHRPGRGLALVRDREVCRFSLQPRILVRPIVYSITIHSAKNVDTPHVIETAGCFYWSQTNQKSGTGRNLFRLCSQWKADYSFASPSTVWSRCLRAARDCSRPSICDLSWATSLTGGAGGAPNAGADGQPQRPAAP